MSRPAITTSLKEFSRTGVLGPIQLGITRCRLLDTIGKPTDSIAGEVEAEASLWWYGSVEVFFDCSDRVHLIHFDDLFGTPRGSDALQIDPWVIRDGMSCKKLEKALLAESISYQIASDKWNPGCVKIVTQGNVYFVVQVEGRRDQKGLRVFGISAA